MDHKRTSDPSVFDNFTTRSGQPHLHTTNHIREEAGFERGGPMSATLVRILSNRSVVLVRTPRFSLSLKEQPVPFFFILQPPLPTFNGGQRLRALLPPVEIRPQFTKPVFSKLRLQPEEAPLPNKQQHIPATRR